MRAEDKLELTLEDESTECVNCGISTEQRDRVMTVADGAIQLLRLIKDSDVWSEGRGSRDAGVLWARLVTLLDGDGAVETEARP